MKLTVLGSGNFIPTVKRGYPGFLVEAGGKLILMDLGSGTIRQLVKAGFDYKKIDIVIINHLDVDHVNDLFSLIQLFNSEEGYKGKKELIIITGKGFKYFLDGVGKFYESARPESGKLELKIYESKTYKDSNLTIEIMPGKHKPSSIIVKIREKSGKELVYTGDTAYNEEISKFTSQPELLITECTAFNDKLTGKHQTPSQAAKMAGLVGAKRLLLVHLAPQNNPADIVWEVPKYYHGRLVIGEDFLKVEF